MRTAADRDAEGDWDREKYRVENRFEHGVQNVEDFPDDAARWAGRTVWPSSLCPCSPSPSPVPSTHPLGQVQNIEDIPQDVENDFDRVKYGVEDRFDDAVQDVEDIPQDIGQGVDNAAEWAGDKFGGVERFGEGIEQSYDEGRDEGRGDGW